MDKVLKKQLEKFGTEYNQVIEAQPEPKKSSLSLNPVKTLMSTMEGRAWMFGKLELCGVNAQSYVPERPIDTAFQCGLREIGLHLQGEIIQVAANEYTIMLQEAATRTSMRQPTPQHQSS